ncbi:MAG TPA: hypothetical protein VKR22_03620, partial [Acidimicrobiales bacterium]|nr:hypothetical protein [Acidimicrobiales bacterium]
APDLVTVTGDDRVGVEEMARRLGLPGVVRAMEMLGQAQVDMRDAPDPRVNLETALIRLSHPAADDSPAAMLDRLDRLERALANGSPSPAPTRPVESPGPSAAPDPGPSVSATGSAATGATPPDPAPAGGPQLARQSLGALRRQAAAAPPSADAPAAPAVADPAPPRSTANGTALPSRDDLVQAWGDVLLTQLPSRARARFRVGRFVAVDGSGALFALPNETHRSYCEDVRLDVEAVLAAHFGTPVPLRLVVDDEAGTEAPTAKPGPGPTRAPEPSAEDDTALLDPEVLEAETERAGAGPSPEQRLKQMFPGAEEL